MHAPLKILLVAGCLLVLQSAWAFIDGLRFLRLVKACRNRPPGSYRPPVSVVIPCKGVDTGFDANLERFLNQDYPNYQIVFVTATAEELAHQALRENLALREKLNTRQSCGGGNPRTELAVAGISDQRGEKVNNLLHGIGAVDHDAQVYVFADIDARPSPDWLGLLVAPLADPQITVSTGFRWYLPGKGFVSRLRAAWDTSIATMLGDHGHNFAWGGSMAIRTADFRRLGVAEKYWQRTVSDDYALTRAVREAGGKIAFEPRCLVASREESSLRQFLRWSTRQIIITRIYAPHLWRLGLATYLFYCGTMASALAALVIPGEPAGARLATAVTLAVVLLLVVGKGYIRAVVAREMFAAEAGDAASCYWRMAPLVPWIMLWNFVAAAFTRRIEWRGTQYELVSRDAVRVMGRSAG